MSVTSTGLLAALDGYHRIAKALERKVADARRHLVDTPRRKNAGRSAEPESIDAGLLDDAWALIIAQIGPFGRTFEKARPILSDFVKKFRPEILAGADRNCAAISWYTGPMGAKIEEVRGVAEAEMFGEAPQPNDETVDARRVFHFRGETCPGITPGEVKIIEVLQGRNEAPIGEVMSALWGHAYRPRKRHALTSALSRLSNKLLAGGKVGITYSITGENIIKSVNHK